MRFCNETVMRALYASLTLVSLFALVAPSAAAEDTKPALTLHATLRAATEAAATDQSLVLLIFGAEWCGPCKKLKSETLASPEFLTNSSTLHLTEADIDTETKMARDFEIQAVPTLILLTADNKIVTRREGFLPVSDLLS
jgi:thioredoxin-like negative regulator of GroEL